MYPYLAYFAPIFYSRSAPSPVAGTFTSAQTVAITSTTSGASIRYTVDGTAPSATAGTIYSAPVSIGATTTLKAIAYKTGYNASAVTSGVYTINLPTAVAPTFSPVAGTYTSVQTVTISSATSGASIRYTTDGSTPTATTGTVYSAAVSVSATTTLKAIAYKTGYNASTVSSSLYTINLPTVVAPVFGTVAGTYTSAQTVAITSTTSGAAIRYTTDGSTPTTTTGTLYTTSVSIGATTTLKAIAYLTGYNNSTVTSGTYTINIPQTVAPTFSPVAGTYTSIQSVAITSTTSGASIRYTTDGSTPTATTGTIYSTPVSVAATITLKAIAYKSGYTDSSVTSGLYTINLPTAAAPTFSPVAGTYTSAQTVTITSTTSGATIRYTTDGSTPSATVGTVYSAPVSIGATSTLKAIAYKTGYTNSSVTSGVYTINLPTAVAPVFSPVAGTYTSAQTVTITSTTSGASIRYTTDGSTPSATVGTVYSTPVAVGATTTLKAIAYKSGYIDSAVSSAIYTLNLTVAAPTFSPVAGTYTSAQTVTIASTTSGATIRYTTDGSTPTATAGTVYSGPINIGATATLKAIAYETGYTSSSVTSGSYTINLTAAAPAFSPAAGTFTSPQTVTIASTTSGASIRYTTDGSTPTATTGTVYSSPVSIGATATLKAIAYLTGYTNSTVTSGTYTINLPTVAAPTFGPVAGTYTSAQTVTIASTTSGASIRYTTDGSTPSATAGGIYSGPVNIGATATLKAIAYLTGYNNSAVTNGSYTINLPTVAAPAFNPVAGTYTSAQTVTITSATSGASIRYTTDGSTPTATTGTVYSVPVGIGATTTLKAIAYFTGYNNSTVTSAIYTINLPTAAAPAFSLPAGTYTSAQTVTITSTTSGATIRYTTDGSTPTATTGTVYSAPVGISATTTLKAIAYFSGYNNSTVTSAIYTMSLPAVDVPTFSPFPGAYTYVPTVEITSTTTGASIVYTTDGTTPTESGGLVTHGKLYSAPLSINTTTTLKAIAFANGFADSAVKSGTYTLKLPVADAPVIYPAAGTYSGPLNVGMTTGTSAHTTSGGLVTGFSFSVAYTTDGTAPTASGGVITHGTLYSGPITVSATTTVKAIAFELRCANSSVATSTFILKPAASIPVFTPGAGTYANALSVTITSATSGASILYTTDGSTPTQTHGTVYAGPVTISSTTILKAIAYVSGSYGDSPVASGLYAITSSPVPIVNVLYDFTPANSGGLNPWASLAQGSDGNFYGTAQFGGSVGSGAVFKITQAGAFTPLVSFNGANGASPEAGLVQGIDGNFYGTTYYGGSADKGTVFKMTPAGVLTTLYSFGGPDGTNPEAGLVQGSDGSFYGMTHSGGPAYPTAPAGCGTIYRITPAGGFTTLVFFGSGIASYPDGDLVLSRDGNFYGHGNDVVFKMTPSGVVTGLFSFYGANKGSSLYGGLAQGNDDNFYGTTMLGGSGSDGTIFKMSPAGGVSTLAPFDGTNGQNPMAGLVMGKNGNFYGTTSGGFNGAAGTLFKVTPGGVLTSLVSFNGTNGANPYAGLVQGSDGNFYGTTYAGGLYNYGTIFQLTIPTTLAPIFNPAPDNYYAAQPLAITSATPGATIRYTTDGSAPSATSGTIYSAPLSLTTTTTLKAIAYASGLDDSAITTGAYLTSLQTAAPIFSPGAGTYNGPQLVTITSTTNGATICYTTDGSTPTETNGTVYSEPLNIGATTTLNAIAYKSGSTDSSVTNGTFLINHPPTITPNSPSSGTVFGSAEHVTLTFNASDADGVVAKIEIYRNGALDSTLTYPSLPPTWTFIEANTLAPGTYIYHALAYDTDGGTTQSSGVTVTILPTLPFMTDFEASEGYTVGTLGNQLGWSVTAGTAQISTSGAAHGTQSILLNSGSTAAQVQLVFGITKTYPSPVFIDFYAKPVAGADATTGTLFDFDAGSVACVLNGATGQLIALDGDGAGAGSWKPLSQTITLDTNHVAATWQRFTMRVDFTAKTYDLYLNGQMIAADLKFRLSTVTYVKQFSVQGATTTSTAFDDFYAGPTNPLFADVNNNGIDDAWEASHGLSLTSGNNNRAGDPDLDGVTNVQEYIAGTDPQDYYNGVAPIITLVSGNNQSAPANQFNALPMVVSVKNSAGAPLANAPVTFSVTSGGGLIANNTSLPSATATLRTGDDGLVQSLYLQPASEGVISQIQASVGSLAVSFAATSSSQPPPPDPSHDPSVAPQALTSYILIDLNTALSGTDSFTYIDKISDNGYLIADRVKLYRGLTKVNLDNPKDPGWGNAIDISSDGTVLCQRDYVEDESKPSNEWPGFYVALIYSIYTPSTDTYHDFEANYGRVTPQIISNHYAIGSQNYVGEVFQAHVNGVLSSAVKISSFWSQPCLLNDNGDYVLNYAAFNMVPQYRLNGGALNYVPVAMNNNKDIIGISYKNAWGVLLNGVPFSSESLHPLALNESGDILALGFSPDASANLFVKNPAANTGYSRIILDQCLPANWHIGRVHELYTDPAQFLADLPKNTNPAISSHELGTMNNNGVIALTAYNDAAGSTSSAISPVPVLLVPASITVDANRDGQIVPNIIGNINSPVPVDTTSKDKPYTFWVNTGIDGFCPVSGETTVQDSLQGSATLQPNCIHSMVTCPRDLENFARLWISLGGLRQAISAGQITVGLEWQSNTGDAQNGWGPNDGAPEINIYAAAPKHGESTSTGSSDYLTDSATATDQWNSAYGRSIVSVARDRPCYFPASTFANLTDTNPNTYFLFEGVTRGAGRLVITLNTGTPGNYTKIGEGGAVYMDLKDIKELYERWTVGDGPSTPTRFARVEGSIAADIYGGGAPAATATISQDRLPNGVTAGFQYGAQQTADDKNYILFVHGWNMPPWAKDAFAETMFKRLYWQGYKGRFGTFQWPTTYHNVDLAAVVDFDMGEYSAWRSALPLKSLLTTLHGGQNGYNLFLLAHSMGNVVAGEALRLAGQAGTQNLVSSYVATQAAVPSHGYDQSLTGGNLLSFGTVPDHTDALRTPNIYNNWFSTASVCVGTMVNFYNINDFALAATVWQLDQKMKPDQDAGGSFPYGNKSDPAAPYGYSGDFTAAPVENGFNNSFIVSESTFILVTDDQGIQHTVFVPAVYQSNPLHLGDVADLKDHYQIMAFGSQPRSKALGGVSSVAGFVPQSLQSLWPADTFEQTQGPYSAHPWHSAQFRFANADQKDFWHALLNQYGLLPP